MSQTTRVGVREAKIHLSRYLKMVKKGAKVIITDRGKPVGKIIPIEPSELSLSERIQRLEEQGIIEPGSDKSQSKLPAPIPVPDAIAQRLLQEDRNGVQ